VSASDERSFIARDGFPLAGTLFRSADKESPVIVVAPALSVPRKYYAHFARHLAAGGFSVVTFDYRGFGGSGPAWRPKLHGGVRTLAICDLASILDEAVCIAGQRPVYFVGHSFGMMVLSLVPNSQIVSRAISLAAGSGYFRFHRFPGSVLRLFFWAVVVPRTARMHGYFPGRRLKLVGDIPQSVAEDLSKMCLSSRFIRLASEDVRDGSASYANEMWAISFNDDEITSLEAVEDFLTNFPDAKLMRSHFSPHDVGRRRVGHMGAFALGSEVLWDQMAQWLLTGRTRLLATKGAGSAVPSESHHA
jgi:predicted alpha/beta hydrolase